MSIEYFKSFKILQTPNTSNVAEVADTSGTQYMHIDWNAETPTSTTKIMEYGNIEQPNFMSLYKEVIRLYSKVTLLERDLGNRKPYKLNIDFDDNKVSKMKTVAESVISRDKIPTGKVIAITYDGDLVAVAESITELLKNTQNINQSDIFVWKVGSDYVDSW